MTELQSYITTPIYYINGSPHIGHASTSVLSDVMKRARIMHGIDIFLTTGTDEHGQKNETKAQESGLTIATYQDQNSAAFKDLFDNLGISYDFFARTSDARHKEVVSEVEQQLFDRNLLTRQSYEGLYCTGCEQFKKETDLNDDQTCPDHPNLVATRLTEVNYFLELEPYRTALRDKIRSEPGWITPESYAQYVLSLLEEPLEPLCVSRPKNRVKLGIELPFDRDYVTFVWLDALLNYLTNIGWPDARSAKWWPGAEHVIGKDIVKTHCVYWPCILMAMQVDLPRRISVHGHWVGTGGLKMSKSLGNVIDPQQVIQTYGTSALRYFIARHANVTSDSNVTTDLIEQAYTSELANKLGNLLLRICKFSQNAFSGVPQRTILPEDEKLQSELFTIVTQASADLCELPSIRTGTQGLMTAIERLNDHITNRAPWKLVKNGHVESAQSASYVLLDCLRLVLEAFYPVMPLIAQAGLKALTNAEANLDRHHCFAINALQPGTSFGDLKVLFPRLDT
ncbi:MAG: methionine--tRNA ligase [Aliishimia sp.]